MAPLERRVLYPPSLPPAGFDPVNKIEDRMRLEEFWLPSYPDPKLEPELYEHWKKMFAEPTYHTPANPQAIDLLAKTFVTRLLPNTKRPLSIRLGPRLATTTFESSRNWSGVYMLPNHGNRFTRVAGQWKVPKVKPGARPEQDRLPFRCSIWIGLDGKKRWTKSMPQVGTVQTVSLEGVPETPKLWWQWWLRDEFSKQQDIPGVPIKAGDVVMCSLIAISPHQVRFHVKNCDTGHFAGLMVNEPVPLLGSSAEWIIEQPADPQVVSGRVDAGPLFPMPDFNSVLFEHCVARAGPEPGDNGQYRPLRSPGLIRLTQSLTQPTRSAVVSTVKRRNEPNGGFRVSYRSPLG